MDVSWLHSNEPTTWMCDSYRLDNGLLPSVHSA
jgi:hypothetical protein